MTPNELLDLAEQIAQRRYDAKIAIESLSDELLPKYDNPGIAAVVQDTVEGWAYTRLDYLQGGIDKPERDEALRTLESVLANKTPA